MKIFIPTLGRLHNQITYEGLPDSWKSITQFVVQPHEYQDFVNAYGSHKVVCLPPNINNLPLTREFIFNNLGHNCRHIVLDDDLKFKKKYPNPNAPPKWITSSLTPEDFNSLLSLINHWIDSGYKFGGLLTTETVPDLSPSRYPYRINHRVMTNFFFDGPNLPHDLLWNRIPMGEDIDITLQLLSRGFSNIVSSHYIVQPSPPNSKGGCSSYRDLDKHNNSQLLLQQTWPQYITTKPKLVDHGPWKGLTKLNVTVQFKKAYASNSRPQ